MAGTTVAEHLPLFDSDATITLISATETVKKVTNLERRGEVVSSFDVTDSTPENQCYQFICGVVNSFDFSAKTVTLTDGSLVRYDKLCLAMGARPNVLYPSSCHVVGIRDTESVQDLQSRLGHCRHVTVVGNGGIASELVFAASRCHITWVIKDQTISSVFVDSVASKFLLDSLKERSSSDETETVSKRQIYSRTITDDKSAVLGSALGPDWYNGFCLDGASTNKTLDIEYECEVDGVEDCTEGSEFNLTVTLNNGKVLQSDVLISATGVVPNSDLVKGKVELSDVDGGVTVNKRMETSVPNVFAAGDICSIPWRESELWKQMRLWTQALQQGFYAARSMAAPVDDPVEPDISFELFTHSTKLFGYKVVLLGRFQEWSGSTCYFRITPRTEFVKLVVAGGRVAGALLIGETDLEEMLENLILNQTDISHLGEAILDPNVDIDDYFD